MDIEVMATPPLDDITAQILGDQIAEHRDFLLRVARLQLSREEDALDVVQETLAGALASAGRFSGTIPLRAWLIGILRHKIIDAIRKRARYVQLDPDDELNPGESEFDRHFQADDCWRPEAVAHGSCPQGVAVHKQLLGVVEFCVAKLPVNTGRVFLMREFLDMDFDEIATELKLTPGNLRVLLYRARMRLRDCVSRGWGELHENR